MQTDSIAVIRSHPEEDSDLEAQQSLPDILGAGIRDPLCRLATNKDGTEVQGKWRLVAAIVLCTLFMVWRDPHDTSTPIFCSSLRHICITCQQSPYSAKHFASVTLA